jgi:hypothetical protein
MSSAGEKAMALVDGQLAPAEVPGLVQELARSADLVRELQDYLAMSRSRLAQPYAAKADEPVPRRLIDAVRGARAEPPQRARPPAARARPSAWLPGSYRVPAWSLAAAPALAAALAFAVAAAILPAGQGGLASGLVAVDLGAALERSTSGKDAPLAVLRPVLSFSSKGARWCRQFEVRNAGKQVSHALACRGHAGGWQVVASTEPAVAGGYAPAGADRRRAIDELVISMLQGEPLSHEAESALIGNGWQQL